MFRRILTLLLCLSLPLLSKAQSGAVIGGKSLIAGNAVMALDGGTPAYQFLADGTSATPTYFGNTPMAPSQAFTLLFSAAVSGGYYDSPAGDGFAQGYNTPAHASDTIGFCTLNQGKIQFTMKYTPAISSGAQSVALEGSAPETPPFDSNDQIKVIGASTANSFKMSFVGANGVTTVSTPDLVMNGAASNTDFLFNGWFSTTLARKLILQIGIDPPTVYCSTLPTPLCTQWHTLRWGKDATAGQAMGIKVKNLYLFTTASFQVTGNFWCDFNFAGTVDGAALATSSHNSQQTCGVVGSGTRFSTNADAFYAQWAPINNQTTTSTTGLRFDLSLTAPDGRYWDVPSVLDQPFSKSVMFNVPTLANGSTIEMGPGAYDASGNQNVSMYQTASGGVQSLLIKTGAGGSSSSITVTAGTWYEVCVDGVKGGTGTLHVYTVGNTEVSGSPVTVTCANHNTTRIFLGSPYDTTTAQAASVYARYSHLIEDSLPSNATPIAPLRQRQ